MLSTHSYKHVTGEQELNEISEKFISLIVNSGKVNSKLRLWVHQKFKENMYIIKCIILSPMCHLKITLKIYLLNI